MNDKPKSPDPLAPKNDPLKELSRLFGQPAAPNNSNPSFNFSSNDEQGQPPQNSTTPMSTSSAHMATNSPFGLPPKEDLSAHNTPPFAPRSDSNFTPSFQQDKPFAPFGEGVNPTVTKPTNPFQKLEESTNKELEDNLETALDSHNPLSSDKIGNQSFFTGSNPSLRQNALPPFPMARSPQASSAPAKETISYDENGILKTLPPRPTAPLQAGVNSHPNTQSNPLPRSNFTVPPNANTSVPNPTSYNANEAISNPFSANASTKIASDHAKQTIDPALLRPKVPNHFSTQNFPPKDSNNNYQNIASTTERAGSTVSASIEQQRQEALGSQRGSVFAQSDTGQALPSAKDAPLVDTYTFEEQPIKTNDFFYKSQPIMEEKTPQPSSKPFHEEGRNATGNKLTQPSWSTQETAPPKNDLEDWLARKTSNSGTPQQPTALADADLAAFDNWKDFQNHDHFPLSEQGNILQSNPLFRDEKITKQKIALATIGAFLVAIGAIYFYTQNQQETDEPAFIYAQKEPYKLPIETQHKDLHDLPGMPTYDRLSGESSVPHIQEQLLEEQPKSDLLFEKPEASTIDDILKPSPSLNHEKQERHQTETSLPSSQEKTSLDSKEIHHVKPTPKAQKKPVLDKNNLSEQQAITKHHQPVSPRSAQYYVQIGAQPSDSLAQQTIERLKKRYPAILKGHSIKLQKADIAGKGIFYRIRIPVNSKEKAVQLCETLKAAGASCFLAR